MRPYSTFRRDTSRVDPEMIWRAFATDRSTAVHEFRSSAARRRVVAFQAAIVVAASPLAGQAPRSLSDSAFAAIIGRASEASGFFDTDNLVSNEDSYLHPLTTLRRVGVSGGVYVGVGPDQNFSYIAAIRPRAAFIVDIRRDNLLEHLLFKSVFARSRNRVEYLALLFGKAAPPDTAGWGARTIDALLDYVVHAPAAVGAHDRVMAEVRRSGIPLTNRDLETIRRFHAAFIAAGPALRFNTFGRAPQAGYPDYAWLAAARDRNGTQASFLAGEAAFRVVKSLEDRNLVIPVVGDFGGQRAFAAVARWMADHHEALSALYASNVEQYLVRDGTFDAFAANVKRLPRDARSVIIRSCFTCRRGHESGVAGFYSVQLTQLADTFVALHAAGRLRQYGDVVYTGQLPP
jgi:hypothetical protein